ncbi:MAG: sugar phosphate nucleotidyltransferase [Candidatus Parvarchaeota archaeon]|nr:sugar phosphate nucleotidyltransferase [Candidatus Parvarchaeota archaeon]
MVNKITKGVILASGNGTRARPASYYIPKPMLPLGQIPMTKRIVYQMINAGIKDILIVSRNDKEGLPSFSMLIDYFRKENVANNLSEYKNKIENGEIKISLDYQPVNSKNGKPLGTAKSLKVAYDHGFLNGEPCAVMFSDVLQQNFKGGKSLLEQMLSKYDGKTLVSMKRNNVKRITEKSAAYCSNIEGNFYKLDEVLEKPPLEYVNKHPTDLSVAGGIYLIDERGANKVRKVKKGAGGEYHITDIIDQEAKSGDVYGYLIDKNEFKSYDVGEFDVLIKENLEDEYKKDFFNYVKNSKPAVQTIFVGGVAMYGSKEDLLSLLSFISK